MLNVGMLWKTDNGELGCIYSPIGLATKDTEQCWRNVLLSLEEITEMRIKFSFITHTGEMKKEIVMKLMNMSLGKESREKQCTYNVKLRGVRVTTVAVEKQ
jgi:hypothetical protein